MLCVEQIGGEKFAGTTILVTPIIFLILVLVGTITFAIKVGRSDKHNIVDTKEDITDFDDDSHWKGGLFYFNRQDPSIFVEKRFGVGWTINFGNPIGPWCFRLCRRYYYK